MQRAIAGIFSFLILFATLGFSISRHYCQGNLMGAKFGGAVEMCCMGMQGTMPDDCCNDEISWLQIDEEFPVFSMELNEIEELKTLVTILVNISPESKDSYPPTYLTYRPPPIVEDLNVRFQTFLI